MVRSLPSFDKMWNNYPTVERPDLITEIGGKVETTVRPTLSTANPWNTCAIRVSRAFNYAGDPIPQRHILQRSPDKRLLAVLLGGDKMWYAYRVNELIHYITEVYGSASGKASMNARDDLGNVLPGTPCLITFNFEEIDKETRRNRAASHIDLWDGKAIRYNNVLLTESTGHSYVVRHWEFIGLPETRPQAETRPQGAP